MHTNRNCPEVDDLTRYAVGRLGPDDTTLVDHHLLECRGCLDRFVELGRKSVAPEVPGCQVVKEIGRGRFGVVYKAWSLRGQPRLVALKVLSQSGDMERSRFEREIAVLKKLDSPGIVKCLDSGVSGDTTYYAMEYVEGTHLDEYFDSASMNLIAKLVVFQRVCCAVADAHAKGVVHRDLKPKNILIDSEGWPHVLDFGVCSLDSDDWSSGARGTLTQPGDVIGTLKYMSPEQAWGGAAGAIDERSDIWALGVMLYGIVTDGGYPYSLRATPDKPVHEALLDRIRKELPQIPKLDTLHNGRDLEVLLQRTLAWEPDRRLKSAAVLAADLDRYCRGRRIKTKPDWFPYRLRRIAVGAAARSRWLFSLMFVTASIVLISASAFLCNVGWLRPGHAYEQPTGETGLPLVGPATAVGLDPSRNSIVIAGIFNESLDAVVDYAGANGLDGVTRDVRTWRGVHGRLMARLAEVGPRVVSWDYYFRTRQAQDEQFVAGVERLEARGTPVVLGSLDYDDDGVPDISPGIAGPLAARLRHGTLVARDTVERPGEFITAIRRPSGRIIPSLALTTLAASLHPATRLETHWTSRLAPLQLYYKIERGAYRKERDVVDPTRAFEAKRPEFAVRLGDLLACNTFELDSPERWASRTVPYETLLTCPVSQLRSLVAGKVLLVGDMRTSRWGFDADRHRVKYGASIVDDVPGAYLQGDALAGLLGGRYIEPMFPLSPAEFAVILAIAILGCLLPMRLSGASVLNSRTARRILWPCLVGAGVLSCLAMVFARERASVWVGVVGVAMLIPMIGSFWVEFTRNRHRIQDAADASTAFQSPTTVGTLTLPRRKSPPRAV